MTFRLGASKDRANYLALAAALIGIGLIWRLAPLGLPLFLFKYGGSAIWGAMVYFLVAAALPRRTPLSSAVVATVLAAASEIFRLYHSPSLDAFRATLAGALLLGRIFSVWNIAAYGVGICAAALADHRIRALALPRRTWRG